MGWSLVAASIQISRRRSDVETAGSDAGGCEHHVPGRDMLERSLRPRTYGVLLRHDLGGYQLQDKLA